MDEEAKWEEAKAYLDMMITAYQAIGFAGVFGLGLTLMRWCIRWIIQMILR